MKTSKLGILLAVVFVVPLVIAGASVFAGRNWLGTITPDIQRHEAVDLGTYDYNEILENFRSSGTGGDFGDIGRFMLLPQNVSMAAIRADVSEILVDGVRTGVPKLGLWVADSSGKVVAHLRVSIGQYDAVSTGKIYAEPWTNTPLLLCTSLRLYQQITDQMAANGGDCISVTFTPVDFRPALDYMGKSAADLTVVGLMLLPYNYHLYTEECTILSVKTTGLYEKLGFVLTSATINGNEYKAEGGVVRLDGPISGTAELRLTGKLLFIPITQTVTVQL